MKEEIRKLWRFDCTPQHLSWRTVPGKSLVAPLNAKKVELLQRDQGTEATGTSFFGAMREPVFGMAGCADPADFNLTYACAFEGEAIRFPQIEMDFSLMRFKQSF